MLKHNKKIKLLAPAKDLNCGVAAIDHGADAVYCGGPVFGARSRAGNSLKDIKALVDYAHGFSSQVYVALNTLFYDDEISKVVELAWQLYETGVDALIIQDFGLLECDLPPINLHASTQMDNQNIEKVQFLEKVGFSKVILARELSLDAIRKIRSKTTVELECFIHGALCVSYSGRCYISKIIANRSANRGECAQFCRHTYNLQDAKGNILAKDQHLLSLKDLNLSAHISQLMDAGISTFKIEGRLKDITYVKNVTAYYRQKIDAACEKSTKGFEKSSSGKCHFSFNPDPEKSFNRGSTNYYIKHKRGKTGQIETPKSMGKELGIVDFSSAQHFTVKTIAHATLQNGDGLCYLDKSGRLVGLRINRVEQKTGHIFTRGTEPHPPLGTLVYRNVDTSFLKLLENSQKCRQISISMDVFANAQHLELRITDEDNIISKHPFPPSEEIAKNHNRMSDVLEKQLKKTGDTVFSVRKFTLTLEQLPFLSVALLNQFRREALSEHLLLRTLKFATIKSTFTPNYTPWLSNSCNEKDNITNTKCKEFFKRHGVKHFELGPDKSNTTKDVPLMLTKYCIRYQLDLCPMSTTGKTTGSNTPLYLKDNTGEYEVHFDCQSCQMSITKKGK